MNMPQIQVEEAQKPIRIKKRSKEAQKSNLKIKIEESNHISKNKAKKPKLNQQSKPTRR